MAKKRIPIPPAIQAQVQFDADRTCCVCRQPGKTFQIHHIDENPANNDPKNLAVLCRDCHDQTMIRGTFNRKLGAEVVELYRDDWLAVVAQKRAEEREPEHLSSTTVSADFSLAAEKIEILKEREEYGFLAMEFDRLGNTNLRDKYIELAIAKEKSDFTAIFLRGMQGRPDKLSAEIVERTVKRLRDSEQWSQLGRTYDEIGDSEQAIINYCKGIIESLENGRIFSGAFYLKELTGRSLHVPLFKQTYERYEADNDIWWALRSLQELEWWSEADALILRHAAEIEASGEHLLLKELYAVTGDTEAYRKLELREVETIESDPETGAVGFLGIEEVHEADSEDS